MTKEGAIEILIESKRQNEIMRDNPNNFFSVSDVVSGVKNARERIDALDLAICVLRAKQERENPKPLTTDELKEMDGEPVWIIPLCVDTGWTAQWRIYTVREPVTVNAKSYGWYGLHLKDYGKTWVAYRHKPKEVQE